MDIKILYEDKAIIICDKPAGMPVQSARIGTKDMVSILKNYRYETDHLKNVPYLGVVHRLDQPVQGVIVFAKTKDAAGKLSAQLGDGRLKKQYLAVLCGQTEEKEGHLVNYLLKDGRSNTSKIVEKGVKDAKRAELLYRILKVQDQRMLAEIDLITGRHHQIRVQMAGAGLPLAGDRKYNIEGSAENSPDGLIALCAHRISLIHPVLKKKMTFETAASGGAFEKFR